MKDFPFFGKYVIMKEKRENTVMKLVVATGNAHKLREIAQIFPEYEVVSQKQMGFDEDVAETGETFAENALIKARAAAKALNCTVIADDSGVCVDAFNGAPGIYSARYCGHHGDDKANRDLLLKNLQGVENRKAHFACAVALVYPDGKETVVTGETHGKILYAEEGDGGFGYDPIFYSDDLGKSFGVATEAEKNAVSHRFRALQALKKELEK